MENDSTRLRLFALGACSAAAQALLLRESMSTLGGSELAWGAVLFLWLTGAAVGARFSTVFRIEKSAALLVAAGSLWGFAALRASPLLAGGFSGHPLNPWLMSGLWPVAVFPSAVATGAGFAHLAGRLRTAAFAYGIESLGAMIGGLAFTFVLVPFGGEAVLSVLLALGLAVSIPRRAVFWAFPVFLVALASSYAAKPLVANATWRSSGREEGLLASRDSRHQRMEVSKGPPFSVYLDGRLSGTLPPDPYLERPAAEFLLLLHPNPRRIAVIGGHTDGTIEAFLGPTIKKLFLIEEDRSLLALLASGFNLALSEAFEDPRLEIVSTDPLRALDRLTDIDLFLILEGPPKTLRTNRTRTREFFDSLSRRLSESGMVLVSSGTHDTYLGGVSGRLVAIQYRTLREVFPQVFALARSPILLLAAKDPTMELPSVAELERRWRLRGPDSTERLDLMIATLLNASRSTAVSEHLAQTKAPPNTTGHPIAVLAGIVLSEGRALHFLVPMFSRLMDAPKWPPAVILILLLTALGGSGFVRMKRRTPPALAVGFVGMTWWLILLGAWQASRGAVYSEVGLLTALFMGGLGAGSLAAERKSKFFGLPLLFSSGFILSGAIFAGAATFRPEITIPSLLVGGGAIVGAAFPGLAELSGGSTQKSGIATAFAADEFGAALAAVIVGILAIPWLGSRAVSGAAGLVCLAGIIAARNPE